MKAILSPLHLFTLSFSLAIFASPLMAKLKNEKVFYFCSAGSWGGLTSGQGVGERLINYSYKNDYTRSPSRIVFKDVSQGGSYLWINHEQTFYEYLLFDKELQGYVLYDLYRARFFSTLVADPQLHPMVKIVVQGNNVMSVKVIDPAQLTTAERLNYPSLGAKICQDTYYEAPSDTEKLVD